MILSLKLVFNNNPLMYSQMSYGMCLTQHYHIRCLLMDNMLSITIIYIWLYSLAIILLSLNNSYYWNSAIHNHVQLNLIQDITSLPSLLKIELININSNHHN